MKPVIIAVALSLILAINTHISAQGTANNAPTKSQSDTKLERVRKLVELLGSNKLGEQVWGQLFPLIKQSAPRVPESEWQEIEKEFSAEFASGRYAELIVAIYEAHFSEDEINQLIAFYESPIGKKVISVLPQIAQEAILAGQQRAREIMKRVYEKLRRKGYSVPTA